MPLAPSERGGHWIRLLRRIQSHTIGARLPAIAGPAARRQSSNSSLDVRDSGLAMAPSEHGVT